MQMRLLQGHGKVMDAQAKKEQRILAAIERNRQVHQDYMNKINEEYRTKVKKGCKMARKIWELLFEYCLVIMGVQAGDILVDKFGNKTEVLKGDGWKDYPSFTAKVIEVGTNNSFRIGDKVRIFKNPGCYPNRLLSEWTKL